MKDEKKPEIVQPRDSTVFNKEIDLRKFYGDTLSRLRPLSAEFVPSSNVNYHSPDIR